MQTVCLTFDVSSNMFAYYPLACRMHLRLLTVNAPAYHWVYAHACHCVSFCASCICMMLCRVAEFSSNGAWTTRAAYSQV